MVVVWVGGCVKVRLHVLVNAEERQTLKSLATRITRMSRSILIGTASPIENTLHNLSHEAKSRSLRIGYALSRIH